jgi:hypothetical protein
MIRRAPTNSADSIEGGGAGLPACRRRTSKQRSDKMVDCWAGSDWKKHLEILIPLLHGLRKTAIQTHKHSQRTRGRELLWQPHSCMFTAFTGLLINHGTSRLFHVYGIHCMLLRHTGPTSKRHYNHSPKKLGKVKVQEPSQV